MSEWVKHKLISFSSLLLYSMARPQPFFYTSFPTGTNQIRLLNFLTSIYTFAYVLLKAYNAIFFLVYQLKLDPFLRIFLKNLLLLKAFPDPFKTYVITYSFFWISKALDFYFSYGMDLMPYNSLFAYFIPFIRL